MQFKSFEINGYYGASFEQGIKCDDLGHINVLIGPNNSGKSIPARVFSLLGGAAQMKVFEQVQSFIGQSSDQGCLSHHLAKKNRYLQQDDLPLSVTLEVIMEATTSQRRFLLTDTLNSEPFVDIEIKFWNFDDGYFVSCNPLIQLADGRCKRHWHDERTIKTARSNMDFHLEASGGYSAQNQAFEPEYYKAVRETQEELKKVRFFEPKRDLESTAYFSQFNTKLNDSQALQSSDEWAISERHITGVGVLDKLAALQNSDETADKSMLADMAKTMNEILTPGGSIGFNSLHITEKDVKGKRKLQLVGADSSVISFENFGTGISALVILLAELLINKSASTYFLEEPEHHLHPGLLARFIQFLKTKCKHHQFIISTHSNTLLDCIDSGDRVYRFSQTKESGCIAELCTSFTDYHLLFDSLGIRASSLMLVNNVIWVEGPSDLTYLRFWLSKYRFAENKDPSLVENSDFHRTNIENSRLKRVDPMGEKMIDARAGVSLSIDGCV